MSSTEHTSAAAARAELEAQLSILYEASEARSMARIVLEELFQTRLVPAEVTLSTPQQTQLAAWGKRLLLGEPLQYVIGNTNFYGLVFATDARALIPRQETEELVRWILETYSNAPSVSSLPVLDIGTGSGCIAVTLKKKRPLWRLTGLDVSADALALAQENATRQGCVIRWLQQDILDKTLWPALGKFDIIVSNPPYIPEEERQLMPEQVLQHEPASALFVPDEDPLLFYVALAQLAALALHPGGRIFFESNEFRTDGVAQVLAAVGFEAIEVREDMQGKPRMLAALLPGSR